MTYTVILFCYNVNRLEEIMNEVKTDKIERILSIYTKLLNGSIINKTREAYNYGVNERSI